MLPTSSKARVLLQLNWLYTNSNHMGSYNSESTSLAVSSYISSKVLFNCCCLLTIWDFDTLANFWFSHWPVLNLEKQGRIEFMPWLRASNSCPGDPKRQERDQTWPNMAKPGPFYQPKWLREANTHDANSGQDPDQALKKKTQWEVLCRRQLVNPSQSHPSAASKQGREIGVGAIWPISQGTL